MSERRFKALDLFSGAGGMTKGLQRAGFYVVGVDIELQPRYCGDEFFQADALTFDLSGYDLICASPPCQFGSDMTPPAFKGGHANLIPATRARLQASGALYVIENVRGSRRHLVNPVMLCGAMFGLKVYRHRFFESNFMLLSPPHAPHGDSTPKAGHGGISPKGFISVAGHFSNVVYAREAMGAPWMIRDELAQAVPPAFGEHFGRQVMAYLTSRAEMAA